MWIHVYTQVESKLYVQRQTLLDCQVRACLNIVLSQQTYSRTCCMVNCIRYNTWPSLPPTCLFGCSQLVDYILITP